MKPNMISNTKDVRLGRPLLRSHQVGSEFLQGIAGLF